MTTCPAVWAELVESLPRQAEIDRLNEALGAIARGEMAGRYVQDRVSGEFEVAP